ncbi:MAG: aldo/keto reductase [Clostridia bacterium]|nr:aldo/keto reductase [Clostridia bacterium]
MLDGALKNFGFGCMRLKLLDNGEVDLDNFREMVDLFMENGFNYFDTAHGYINHKSETAIRECLVKRYPRESFILTDKLSDGFFKTEEEILPLFESQLAACGVDYFDYYLMHAHNAELFEKYNRLHAYEIVSDLIKQGRVKHLGISFHDKADVLDMILTGRPEIEVVQLQFNYLDYEDDNVQAKKCYDVCVKHGKDVIVMEPVRGGRLANLPLAAQRIYDEFDSGYAEFAIRWAAGFDNVRMVLSGMNDTAQMRENIGYMKDFRPLDDKELAAVEKVCSILKNQNIIPCTACGYCVDGCPADIKIPRIFELLNSRQLDSGFDFDAAYSALTEDSGEAADCIKCCQCEHICPQKLKITELLETV